jgi:DNA-binding transcriptional ArsR family regulator
MPLDDVAPGQSSPPSPQPELPEIRHVTDAQTMRALSHPVRIALIEELSLEGPMTATEVGERIGESPTTCSFHLRQLAKYGFVEEAGGGKGRARPWRMVSIAQRFSAQGDPETELAQDALASLIRDRQLDRYRTWLDTKASYPREWRKAANHTEYVFYLTAEELEQLNDELLALLTPRALERVTDPSRRPPGSVPVEMLMFTYPLRPPAPEGGERPMGQKTERSES